MATSLLPSDFKDFLKLLSSHHVEYLLIGGYARATTDMDIWIAIHPDNAEKMMAVLHEFGFGVETLSAQLFLTQNKIIRMGLPPFCIEILTNISGVNFSECYQHRTTDTIDGISINIIGLQQLKVNKRASGRHKDLDDLENLP